MLARAILAAVDLNRDVHTTQPLTFALLQAFFRSLRLFVCVSPRLRASTSTPRVILSMEHLAQLP
jgi:hypothetical protein